MGSGRWTSWPLLGSKGVQGGDIRVVPLHTGYERMHFSLVAQETRKACGSCRTPFGGFAGIAFRGLCGTWVCWARSCRSASVPKTFGSRFVLLLQNRLFVQGVQRLQRTSYCTSWKRTPPSRRAMSGSVGPERLSFEQQEVARYPTREQAEWRARELNEEAERSPRGYVQYLVRPVREPPKKSRQRTGSFDILRRRPAIRKALDVGVRGARCPRSGHRIKCRESPARAGRRREPREEDLVRSDE